MNWAAEYHPYDVCYSFRSQELLGQEDDPLFLSRCFLWIEQSMIGSAQQMQSVDDQLVKYRSHLRRYPKTQVAVSIAP